MLLPIPTALLLPLVLPMARGSTVPLPIAGTAYDCSLVSASRANIRQVYSCEYQNLAINAMENCEIATVFPPYVPAPHDAPGYCSCNIGYVYFLYRVTKDKEYARCRNNILNLQAEDGPDSCYPYCYKDQTICTCCASSSATSAYVLFLRFRFFQEFINLLPM